MTFFIRNKEFPCYENTDVQYINSKYSTSIILHANKDTFYFEEKNVKGGGGGGGGSKANFFGESDFSFGHQQFLI